MSALSDYLEVELLDHLLAAAAAPQPATLYIGLFTADPGESGVTSEVSGGAYARASVTNNATNWPACAVTGTPTKSNGATITFATATASWGTITHWAIYDAVSGATNMLAHGALTQSRLVSSGDTPKIVAGGISISFSNAAAGGLTVYAQRRLLDHVFGAITFTAPSMVAMGIGTALSGEAITEWDDTNYARQQLAFTTSTGKGITTTAETFNANVAAIATLTHWGLWDDLSAGNLLAVGALNTSKSAAVADSVTMAAGQLTVELQ